MIRNILKRVARRVLGGDDAAPAPARPPPPPPPATRVVDEEPEEEPDIEIERDQMATWLTDDQPVHLVDIREGHEVQHGYALDALLIPMNDIPQRLDDLPDKEARVVIYCAAGGRSYGVTGYLREQGWTDVWSLVGGFGAYVAAGGTDALRVESD